MKARGATWRKEQENNTRTRSINCRNGRKGKEGEGRRMREGERERERDGMKGGGWSG